MASAFAAVAPALVAWARLKVRGELLRHLEPEDLVQEVVVRACLRQREYEPERGSFRAWVFGFAQRVWLEALRELARNPLGTRRRTGGDSQLPQVVDSITAISTRAARDEQLRACSARLAQLEEVDQRLLACVGLEGVSHADAAGLLGITADACRKRWQRLRERLQGDPVLRSLLAG